MLIQNWGEGNQPVKAWRYCESSEILPLGQEEEKQP